MRLPLGLFAMLCLLASCSQPPEAAAPAQTRFPIAVGHAVVQMELALSEGEQRQGLMFRKHLDADSGMLFVYEKPQQMTFWMKNTGIPLDVGFFDTQGILREVRALHPHDLDPVSSSREDLRFALEVPQGWFSANQIHPGAALDMEALASALRARGLSKERISTLTRTRP